MDRPEKTPKGGGVGGCGGTYYEKGGEESWLSGTALFRLSKGSRCDSRPGLTP